MNCIYTGKGDNGCSSTISERDIPKNSPVFELLGALDECSAALGLARSFMDAGEKADDVLRLQKELVGVCGELAGGEAAVSEESCRDIEKMIDTYSEESGGFQKFELFGEDSASSALNLARAVARRAERAAAEAGAAPEMKKYLNRLSDLIFVMSLAK